MDRQSKTWSPVKEIMEDTTKIYGTDNRKLIRVLVVKLFSLSEMFLGIITEYRKERD